MTELSEYCDKIENIHDRYVAAQAFLAGYKAGLIFFDEAASQAKSQVNNDPYANVDMTPDSDGKTIGDVNDR